MLLRPGTGSGFAERSAIVYGMQRPREELVRRRDLDDPAEVHDGNAVGDVADDGEVVGDEDVGEVELLLQLDEQVQHLRLDRDVERRDRLVGDDELRLQHERAREPDPLPLAAAELVRVAVGRLGRHADALEHLVDDARRGPCAPARPWIPSPSAIRSPTFIRGSSEPTESWKTICMCRRISFIALAESPTRSTPSKVISPSVGSSRRRIVRPSVDLPHPDSPTRPTVSPRRISRSTPSTACR